MTIAIGTTITSTIAIVKRRKAKLTRARPCGLVTLPHREKQKSVGIRWRAKLRWPSRCPSPQGEFTPDRGFLLSQSETISIDPCRARVRRVCLLVFVASVAGQEAIAANPRIQIPPGKGDFQFVDRIGDPSKEITVFTYLPENVKVSEAPIVFVMHGHHRSAEGYRNNWAKHAKHFGFMVLAPLFDEKQWGHNSYTYASVVGKNGKIREPCEMVVRRHRTSLRCGETINRQQKQSLLLVGLFRGGAVRAPLRPHDAVPVMRKP